MVRQPRILGLVQQSEEQRRKMKLAALITGMSASAFGIMSVWLFDQATANPPSKTWTSQTEPELAFRRRAIWLRIAAFVAAITAAVLSAAAGLLGYLS